MPERWYLCYVGRHGIGAVECASDHPDAVPYVPESALLAAEARVREVEAAFKKYGDHWAQCPAMTPRRKCNCGYAQARAILAREAGE